MMDNEHSAALEDRVEALAGMVKALREDVDVLRALHAEGECRSVKEEAAWWGVSIQVMRQMMRDGRMPHHVIGRRKKVTPEDHRRFEMSVRAPLPGEEE